MVGDLAVADLDPAGSDRGDLRIVGDEDDGAALGREAPEEGVQFYRAAGWVEYGRVPGHALRPDGQPAETTMFYKRLDGGISPV